MIFLKYNQRETVGKFYSSEKKNGKNIEFLNINQII